MADNNTENISKGEITLSKPLKIMDKTYKKLKYDSEKITGDMWDEAMSHQVKDFVEMDSAVQRYLGFEAVIAEQPEIDIMDLEKNIHGRDLYKFMVIGRNFTMDWLDELVPESSEEESESTPTTAVPASEKSKNSPS